MAARMKTFPELRDALSSNDNSARVLVFEDIELPLRIGVYPQEKLAPQRVRISVELLVLPQTPDHSDRIDNVVDYDRIHGAILRLAERPHIELQETLADEIARLCFDSPEAAAVQVYVRKLDVYNDCKSVGIRIVRTRPQKAR
jgi:dihydroneopterin aldolase